MIILFKKIARLSFFALFIIGISISQPACKSKRHASVSVTPDPPHIVNKQDLSEQQAIDICKKLLATTNKTVSIQFHYWDIESKQVPCSQYDVDAGVHCSTPAPPSAPYGYKNASQQVRKCCEQKNFPLYNSIGTWGAEYSQKEDKWTVTYQFNADDLKYFFSWIVDDNSSGVTEKGLSQ